MHNCSSYANIVWASTSKSKLKKLVSLQEQACRIIFHEPRNAHSATFKTTTSI